MRVDKETKVEFNPARSLEFMSKLTVVKGLKDSIEPTPVSPREKRKKPFKNWSMPEQPGGYIKCREFDFL